jgi:sugar lactone lactonase YvrE
MSLVLLVVASCGDVADEGPRVQVFVEGAQVRGANGILFGPDGNLYIASVVTPGIVAMNPETGEIVRQLGPDDGAKGPDDLAFGSDGSLYWTDILYGEVGRLTPGGAQSVIANVGPGVNPITVSDDGRVFVSQCFMGFQLFEVDPDGLQEPRLITDQLGPGCGLNGMDWGPDGFLYGPRWFQGEVVRVDVETGDFQTVADGFGVPAAVKFDSEGRLHVLDNLRGEIVRVDREAGTREIVGRIEPRSADNLAFNDEGRLFVSSYTDGSIVEVLDENRTRIVSLGGLNIPGGVALVDTEDGERLFIADLFALRVLDAEDGHEIETVRDVIGFSELGSAMSVRSDGESVLVTSWFDNDVKVWDPHASVVSARFEGFGQPVDGIPFQGDIVVTEGASGSVVRFNPSNPDQRTVLSSGLEAPAGLAARGRDLYVGDRAAGQVLRILEKNQEVQPPGVVADGLEGPEGMEFGEDGRLFVVEADAGRVVAIDLETGDREILAEGLDLHLESQPGSPPSFVFNGIAVGDRRAFVTGDRESLLYRIDF